MILSAFLLGLIPAILGKSLGFSFFLSYLLGVNMFLLCFILGVLSRKGGGQ